jgi:hypothetical protein
MDVHNHNTGSFGRFDLLFWQKKSGRKKIRPSLQGHDEFLYSHASEQR